MEQRRNGTGEQWNRGEMGRGNNGTGAKWDRGIEERPPRNVSVTVRYNSSILFLKMESRCITNDHLLYLTNLMQDHLLEIDQAYSNTWFPY